MAPESFRPRLKIDDEKERTYTQTSESNLPDGATKGRIADVLADKGSIVHAIGTEDTVAAAIAALREHGIGAIIVKQGEAMTGIFSERDVVRVLADDGADALAKPVSAAMTPNPKTCAPSDPLFTVAQRMNDGGFRHMPVIDINSNLIGMVSIRDVVAYRLREIEYEALKMKQMIIG